LLSRVDEGLEPHLGKHAGLGAGELQP
jgi:hypothetical protein